MTEKEFRSAKAFLCRGRGLRNEIRDVRQRIGTAYSLLTGASGGGFGERVKSSGGNAEEWRRVEYGELIHTLESLEKRLSGVLSEIVIQIDRVDDARHRRLLNAYYVDGMTLEAAAEKIGVSYRHVHRLFKKALRAFAEVYTEAR